MSTVIRKGLIGKNDIKFYTAASPTYWMNPATSPSAIPGARPRVMAVTLQPGTAIRIAEATGRTTLK